MRGYIYAACSVLLVTLAQLVMKWGMSHLSLGNEWQLNSSFIQSNINSIGYVCSGLLAYALSMVCWMAALNTLALNRAYPLLSISYGLVYLLAIFLPGFNETFSLIRSLGVCLIVAGVVLIHWQKTPHLE